MGEHNMDHMDFIDRVAASDCDVLREKEATYKGSWKMSGGRSAWFMARRNMDRLLNMMASPERPEHFQPRLSDIPAFTDEQFKFLLKAYIAEDIFAKIEEQPGGEDGTVLAVLRDLRRYCTLVEAEMMARGVVPAPAEPELGAEDKEVLDAYLRRENLKAADVVAAHRPEKVVTINEVDEQMPELRPLPLSAWHSPEEDTFGGPRPHPSDGSHHASLVPWQLDFSQYSAFVARLGHDDVDRFWRRVTANIFRLETVVDERPLPPDLHNHYIMGEGCWLINLEDLPDELRDCYPHLQPEMNAFEYEQSLREFRFMYENREGKWRLRDEYQLWAREG
jgi:hypothetical protein